jgi:hypothetical protein
VVEVGAFMLRGAPKRGCCKQAPTPSKISHALNLQPVVPNALSQIAAVGLSALLLTANPATSAEAPAQDLSASDPSKGAVTIKFKASIDPEIRQAQQTLVEAWGE